MSIIDGLLSFVSPYIRNYVEKALFKRTSTYKTISKDINSVLDTFENNVNEVLKQLINDLLWQLKKDKDNIIVSKIIKYLEDIGKVMYEKEWKTIIVIFYKRILILIL